MSISYCHKEFCQQKSYIPGHCQIIIIKTGCCCDGLLPVVDGLLEEEERLEE